MIRNILSMGMIALFVIALTTDADAARYRRTSHSRLKLHAQFKDQKAYHQPVSVGTRVHDKSMGEVLGISASRTVSGQASNVIVP